MTMKRFLALEEQRNEDTGIPVTPHDPETSVICSLVEIQDAETELYDYSEAISEGQQTSDTLASIAVHVQQTLPDGGLTEPVAQALTAALEHFVSRLGSRRRVMPALEHFGNASRKQSTVLALESLKSIGASIWKYIKEAFSKLSLFIKNLFTKSKQTQEKVKVESEKIKHSVEKAVSDKSSSEKEIYSPRKDKIINSAKDLDAFMQGDKAEGSDGAVAPLAKMPANMLFSKHCKEKELTSEYVLKCFEAMRKAYGPGTMSSMLNLVTNLCQFGKHQLWSGAAEKNEIEQTFRKSYDDLHALLSTSGVKENSFGTNEFVIPSQFSGSDKFAPLHIVNLYVGEDRDIPYCDALDALKLSKITAYFSDVKEFTHASGMLSEFIEASAKKLNDFEKMVDENNEVLEKERAASFRQLINLLEAINYAVINMAKVTVTYTHCVNQYMDRGVEI